MNSIALPLLMKRVPAARVSTANTALNLRVVNTRVKSSLASSRAHTRASSRASIRSLTPRPVPYEAYTHAMLEESAVLFLNVDAIASVDE